MAMMDTGDTGDGTRETDGPARSGDANGNSFSISPDVIASFGAGLDRKPGSHDI